MFKKFIAILTVIVYTYFLFGCTTTMPSRNKAGKITSSPAGFMAIKFPEVVLATNDLVTYRGKLVSLESKEITLLPSPYWNIKSFKIDLNEVRSISLVKEKDSATASGFAGGFACGFLFIGIIGGVVSKYNEAYTFTLVSAGAAGLAAGLVGLIIGAAADASEKTKYEFHEMKDTDKIKALKKIMGL